MEERKHRKHKDFNTLSLDGKLMVLLRKTRRHMRFGRRDTQDQIIKLLSRHEQMTQKELQEILDIQAGSLSEVLKKLEDKDFIIKTVDEEDKRSMNVSLSVKGKEAVAEIHANHKEKMGKMFSALTDAEKETLVELLTKLVASYKEEDGLCQHRRHAHRHKLPVDAESTED